MNYLNYFVSSHRLTDSSIPVPKQLKLQILNLYCWKLECLGCGNWTFKKKSIKIFTFNINKFVETFEIGTLFGEVYTFWKYHVTSEY